MKYILFLFLLSCATPPIINLTPLGVTMLPKNIDIDSVLPEAKRDFITPNKLSHAFPPMMFSIDPTTCISPQSGNSSLLNCKNGFLIDEHTFSQQNITDQAKLKQLITTQNSARTFFKTQFEFIRDAESKYQKRIVELDKELVAAKTPTLWSRISYPVGILTGIVGTVGIIYFTSEVIK